MLTETDEQVEGVLADPVDVFYVEWAQETIKKNVQTLNDMLGRLVVLTTSLVGGGLVLLNKDMIGAFPKAVALTFFLAALLAALAGLSPIRVSVDFLCADEVRQYKQATINRKWFAMMGSFTLLLAGFAVAILGVYAKQL